MKTRNILVLALALVASIYAANYLVGCSGEKSSNPMTSGSPDAIYFRDTVAFLTPDMYEDGEANKRESLQPTAAYSLTQWHGFSQSYRNQLIFDKAMSENGWLTNYNCKTWSQHIVSDASGCITLPQTAMPTVCPKADGYVFCASGNVRVRLQNQSANPNMFQRGNVMQMWYGGTYKPHTAFVYWADAGGITFIDCNFVATGKVAVHWMSWTTFYSKVPAYTLYEVL